jgi:hypothetical protein
MKKICLKQKKVKKTKEQLEMEELLPTLTRKNILRKLKELGKLEEACKNTKIPVYILKRYGVNLIQFNRLIAYLT